MQTRSFGPSVAPLAFAVAATVVVLVTVLPGDVAALALVPPTSKFGRSRSNIERRHCIPAAAGAATAATRTRRAAAIFSPVCVLSFATSSSLVVAAEEVRVGGCDGTETTLGTSGGDWDGKGESAANPAPVLPLHRFGNGGEDEVEAKVDAIYPIESSQRSPNVDVTVSGFATSIAGLTEAGGEGPEPIVTNEEKERERVPARGGAERPIFEGDDLGRDAERRWHTPAPIGSNVRLALPRVGLCATRPGRERPCGGTWMGSSVAQAATRISRPPTASLGPLCATRDGGVEERKDGSAEWESDDDDDGVDKFDGGGFVRYLAPYAAALIASIAVTAAFLNFLLTEY